LTAVLSSPDSIRTEDLVRVFRRGPPGDIVVALDHVNLSVARGEIFGLLGPNGAGKTTLIKILSTLLLPSSGRAYVEGLEVARHASEIRHFINLVSGGETPGYGILTTKENLWFFSQLYGLTKSVALDRIARLTEMLGLGEYANVRMSKLSTGFKQRLNLARGFINEPRVLFLDEPTLGLDVITAHNLRQFVKEWAKKADSPKTVLLTTHYMAEADEMCDRVAIISQGRILACDSPANLKVKLERHPTVKVELATDLADFLWVKSTPGVLGFSESSNIEAGITTLKVLVADESSVADLLAAFAAKGLKVLSINKTEPTLEDVYVSLVGKGLD
jgi:ABC-2 type transport system ATP-binding protein